LDQRLDPVTFFASADRFRRWLVDHHTTARVLWVGFHRKASGRGGITYPEALDEALCFGWIDGLRQRVNGSRYKVRFTPRKPGSTWSLVNTKRARELKKLGRLHASGLKAFAARDPRRTGVYSFENDARKLSPEYERRLRANPRAWKFFRSQAPWYQRTSSFWVMSAKREVTREHRLARLIEDSACGQPIPPLKGSKNR
jgi:uncharacterized protein YdeI (YjbR/CyaY-like superfamily)